MELGTSKKVVLHNSRIRNDIDCMVKCKTQEINSEFQKKVQSLEFYLNELVSRKESLICDVTSLSLIKNRTEQSLKSLQYPKEICRKCLEIRKTIPHLCTDAVQNELKKETELIETTETFYSILLTNLQEQLRRNRSVIYSLEGDLQQKRKALKIEKQNENLKTTDLELDSIQNDDFVVNLTNLQTKTEWERNSQKILNNAKTELENGQKLKLHTDESLSSKTAKLIEQHDHCNEVFYKCDAHHKDTKTCLENKLSNVNEQIPQIKQSLKEIEISLAENESRVKLARVRLNNRVQSSCSELLNDNVEMALIDELKQLSKVKTELNKNWQSAQSSLSSLNKLKNYYETEIEAEINVIKIDEVQCLPLRSSIHYHVY